MFIDANQITVLIQKWEAIAEEASSVINLSLQDTADKIVQDLEALIDDEAARLEKMADDFEAEEYGRLELEEAALQKEARVDFNWPHGV